MGKKDTGLDSQGKTSKDIYVLQKGPEAKRRETEVSSELYQKRNGDFA